MGARLFDPRGIATAARGQPAPPESARPRVAVETYSDYPAAQRAVDHLSDNGFPVDRTAIVGTNLRLVEEVLGRMTTPRAALAGLGTGAWFGLLIGLLLGIFTVGAWWGVILAAVLIGAVWGAVFGAVAHAMTGGRRDFTSASTLQADEYAVLVDSDQAERARELLAAARTRTEEARA
jgi:hypothetical protein